MASDGQFSLPETHEDVFRAIAKLDSGGIRRLLDAVDKGSKTGTINGLQRAVTAAGFEDPGTWGEALMAGSVTRSHMQVSSGEIASTIARQLDIDDDGRNKIETVLDTPALVYISKARELAVLGPIMMSARIVSDIRPVFDDDVIGEPLGAVVRHSLEMSYVDDDNVSKNVRVVIDDDDIEVLSAQLLRAKEKSVELGKFMDKAGLRQYKPYLEDE